MDRDLRGYYGSGNGIKLNDETNIFFLDKNLVDDFKAGNTVMNQGFVDVSSLPTALNSSSSIQSYIGDSDCYSHEDCDLSDVVLKYISQMLMEEDMEERACMFQESAALQAAEKSFYEVIGEKYPPSPDHHPIPDMDQNTKSPDENYVGNCNLSCGSVIAGNGDLSCLNCNLDLSENEAPYVQSVSVDLTSQFTSQSSCSSSSSTGTVSDGPVDSPVSTLRIPDVFSDSQSVKQFKKGVEEATKFLPNASGFFANLGDSGLLTKEQKKESEGVVVKMEQQHENEYSAVGLRGRKTRHLIDSYLEGGRNNKQSAVYTESTVRSELFDMVLLCSAGQRESALREALQNETSKVQQQNSQSKGSNGGKARGKKGGKRDVVDLRTLLTLCAQAITADDRRSATEFLKQIRQNSSPTGDGMQRLAHYFAGGLEARMAGSGTQIYRDLITMPTSAADVLKAYHLYLAASPFRKISNLFSNKTIMNVAENATRLHIIDFGMLYGFQWPSLIQRLSNRRDGPPKLRITGIDFPHPGFRPSERVEETGRRLANYAETFKVPFEFNGIAQKWETIQIEDLKIDKDEVLVVNCLYRFRNLLDETVVLNSPRDIVLNLIRKMNPDIFIQGIVNGAYNSPFFITRFREALFHFSALFDMLETNIPRETPERGLIEKIIFGREAMNVIACETAERVERPETYKQWQVRNLRAGFRQLVLNEEIKKMAKEWVKSYYHKDFVIDEDGQWMLQGWKGRIVYALSSWRPAY
ncbi:unnamed protein product [Ilex paraguariensis]|uniref:Scarecrow-like protein 9 n=1 Tax=Ilex paraguariensis TaxID=185542 RepID=A0ABC8QN00_9AQUA